jgi:hypothetical protein
MHHGWQIRSSLQFCKCGKKLVFFHGTKHLFNCRLKLQYLWMRPGVHFSRLPNEQLVLSILFLFTYSFFLNSCIHWISKGRISSLKTPGPFVSSGVMVRAVSILLQLVPWALFWGWSSDRLGLSMPQLSQL